MTIAKVVAACAVLIYGSITLFVAFIYTLLHRETWLGTKAKDKENLRSATRELWSLSNVDSPISHHFLTLPNGIQLHYLSPSHAPRSIDALIIILHGFPDSSHIWSRQLRAATPQNAKIVALDLPGCGGSDSLSHYGPNQVLNTIAEAIVQLKARYLTGTQKRKSILVGHDWGGAITFRLAAETSNLVDNIILINSVYPNHAEANIRAKVSQCSESFHAWVAKPSQTSLLHDGRREIQPVLAQLHKSNYMFLLIMPIPLARIFPHLSTCLVKFCHRLAHRGPSNMSPLQIATSLAMSCGPTVAECNTRTADDLTYGPSVLKRAQNTLPGDWDQRVQLYQHGLGQDEWTPDYSAMAEGPRLGSSGENVKSPKSSPSSKRKTSPGLQMDEPHRFKYPVDIIYGLEDEALDPRIVLDGIEEYFMKKGLSSRREVTAAQNHIIKLPTCGHWSFLVDEGAEALESLLIRLSKP